MFLVRIMFFMIMSQGFIFGSQSASAQQGIAFETRMERSDSFDSLTTSAQQPPLPLIRTSAFTNLAAASRSAASQINQSLTTSSLNTSPASNESSPGSSELIAALGKDCNVGLKLSDLFSNDNAETYCSSQNFQAARDAASGQAKTLEALSERLMMSQTRQLSNSNGQTRPLSLIIPAGLLTTSELTPTTVTTTQSPAEQPCSSSSSSSSSSSAVALPTTIISLIAGSSVRVQLPTSSSSATTTNNKIRKREESDKETKEASDIDCHKSMRSNPVYGNMLTTSASNYFSMHALPGSVAAIKKQVKQSSTLKTSFKNHR